MIAVIRCLKKALSVIASKAESNEFMPEPHFGCDNEIAMLIALFAPEDYDAMMERITAEYEQYVKPETEAVKEK